jgi:hypothetical protein
LSLSDVSVTSLRHESVNGVSCTRTDISIYRDCLADMPVELVDIPVEFVDMPVKLADMPVEVMWFFVTGFLFVECFWGCPWPCFIVGLVGLVSSWGIFNVGRGVSSLFGMTS